MFAARHRIFICAFATAGLVLTFTSAAFVAESANAPFPKKIESTVLPNAIQITDNIISGGLPEGDEAFQQLADLGVKTVISVDGMKPDVATAKKHGLRYVHLPHGYDGVPSDRLVELAKAVRELPGLIYIHCHHGKHRSPAAAASACIAAGVMTTAQGLAVLEVAGTGKNYLGLFQSVREAKPIDAATLASAKVEFPEASKIPPLAEAMTQFDHTFDHLKLVAGNNWKPTPKHPDIAPAHEALLLHEHFTELLRTDDTKRRPAAFQSLAKEGEANAERLEQELTTKTPDLGKANAAFTRITHNCAACHKQFRDVPLKEKAAQQ